MSEITDYWSGPGGEKWAANHEAIDRGLENITRAWLATIPPTGSILDVGCGCGEVTRRLAAKATSVLGIDISPPLLAVARGAGGTYLQADAATYPFEPVDLVASRFGVMFFDDPVAAFANLRKASRRLACVIWAAVRDNEWVTAPMSVLRDLPMPDVKPYDPHAPGPFALADEARTRDILARAGFEHVELARYTTTMVLGQTKEEALEHISTNGPFARVISQLDANTRAIAIERAREVVRPELGASVWFVTAS